MADHAIDVWRLKSSRDLDHLRLLDEEADGWVKEADAVFLAGAGGAGSARAWISVSSYDGRECALLFEAPPGDEYRAYVRALLEPALGEAPNFGYETAVCHWRAGWASAQPVLAELGFVESAPESSVWKRDLAWVSS